MNWKAFLVIAVALVVGYVGASNMMVTSFSDYFMIALGAFLIYCAYKYNGSGMKTRAALGIAGALLIGYNLRMLVPMSMGMLSM
jgi:hypothetical protein